MTILSTIYDAAEKDEDSCTLELTEGQAKGIWHSLNICLSNHGLMPDHYKSPAAAVMGFLAIEIDNAVKDRNNKFTSGLELLK